MPEDLEELPPTEPAAPRDISTVPLIFGTVAVLALAVVMTIAALVATNDDETAASAGSSVTRLADRVRHHPVIGDGRRRGIAARHQRRHRHPQPARWSTPTSSPPTWPPARPGRARPLVARARRLRAPVRDLRARRRRDDGARSPSPKAAGPSRRSQRASEHADARRDGLRPDDRGHARHHGGVPGRDRGRGQPAARADRGEGRRHQGVRPHDGAGRLGGVTRQGRRGLDLQRHGARSDDGPRGRRQGRGAGAERPAHRHRHPLARRERRQRQRRRGAAHPGPHRTRDHPSPTRSRPTSRRWPCTTPTPTVTCSCPTGCSAPSSWATCASPAARRWASSRSPPT